MPYYFAQLKDTSRVEVFYSKSTPTPESHGHLYGYVTGPYQDKPSAVKAAQWHFTMPDNVGPVKVHCVDNRSKALRADRDLARILGY